MNWTVIALAHCSFWQLGLNWQRWRRSVTRRHLLDLKRIEYWLTQYQGSDSDDDGETHSTARHHRHRCSSPAIPACDALQVTRKPSAPLLVREQEELWSESVPAPTALAPASWLQQQQQHWAQVRSSLSRAPAGASARLRWMWALCPCCDCGRAHAVDPPWRWRSRFRVRSGSIWHCALWFRRSEFSSVNSKENTFHSCGRAK